MSISCLRTFFSSVPVVVLEQKIESIAKSLVEAGTKDLLSDWEEFKKTLKAQLAADLLNLENKIKADLYRDFYLSSATSSPPSSPAVVVPANGS